MANQAPQLTPAGTLDTIFSGAGKLTTSISSGNDYGFSVAVQPDGKILLAGASHNGSNYDIALVRYNGDGTLDTSFSGDGKLTTQIGSGDDLGYSVVMLAAPIRNGSWYEIWPGVTSSWGVSRTERRMLAHKISHIGVFI
jgi:uncharacterized delta-60 repeat protein